MALRQPHQALTPVAIAPTTTECCHSTYCCTAQGKSCEPNPRRIRHSQTHSSHERSGEPAPTMLKSAMIVTPGSSHLVCRSQPFNFLTVQRIRVDACTMTAQRGTPVVRQVQPGQLSCIADCGGDGTGECVPSEIKITATTPKRASPTRHYDERHSAAE